MLQYGEYFSASAASFDGLITELRDKLCNFYKQLILKMDETFVFFKLFPRRVYISEDECNKSVIGTKAMNSKNRITVNLCTNPMGSKVPVEIILKPNNARCSRFSQPPVPSVKEIRVVMDRHFEDGGLIFYSIPPAHNIKKCFDRVIWRRFTCRRPFGPDIIYIYIFSPFCQTLRPPISLCI